MQCSSISYASRRPSCPLPDPGSILAPPSWMLRSELFKRNFLFTTVYHYSRIARMSLKVSYPRLIPFQPY